jgi:hypothetical protein
MIRFRPPVPERLPEKRRTAILAVWESGFQAWILPGTAATTGKMPNTVALGRLPVVANSPGSPGSADVLVGMANEKANEEALNDEPLAAHSQANENVGAPRKPARLFCARLHPKATVLGEMLAGPNRLEADPLVFRAASEVQRPRGSRFIRLPGSGGSLSMLFSLALFSALQAQEEPPPIGFGQSGSGELGFGNSTPVAPQDAPPATPAPPPQDVPIPDAVGFGLDPGTADQTALAPFSVPPSTELPGSEPIPVVENPLNPFSEFPPESNPIEVPPESQPKPSVPANDNPFWQWSSFQAASPGASPPGVLSATNSNSFSGFVSGAPGTQDRLNDLLDGFGFSAALAGTYDTNASRGYGAPGQIGQPGQPGQNSDDDFFATLSGSAAYRTQGSEWTYGLNYSGSYSEYFSLSELSGYTQSAGGSVNYQSGPLTASLNAGLSLGSGANRYYQSVVDETTYNYSLNAAYRYSRKTSITGNLSQSFSNANGGFSDAGSFNAGLSALWQYSPRTQFGPGIRYSQQSGDTQEDLRSIGPTMTVNYRLSEKVSLNSQVGLDFNQYEGGESADPSLSAAIAASYRLSSLSSMNLSLTRGQTASQSSSGRFEERTSMRLGYTRKIRRASWNLGASYEFTSFDAPETVVGTSPGDRNYFSLDSSLGMPVFADTCSASIFTRYSDESGGGTSANGDSFQVGFSLSRSF